MVFVMFLMVSLAVGVVRLGRQQAESQRRQRALEVEVHRLRQRRAMEAGDNVVPLRRIG